MGNMKKSHLLCFLELENWLWTPLRHGENENVLFFIMPFVQTYELMTFETSCIFKFKYSRRGYIFLLRLLNMYFETSYVMLFWRKIKYLANYTIIAVIEL